MISIPSEISANQIATQNLSERYNGVIDNMEQEIQETMTQLDVGLAPPGKGSAISESDEFMDEHR